MDESWAFAYASFDSCGLLSMWAFVHCTCWILPGCLFSVWSFTKVGFYSCRPLFVWAGICLWALILELKLYCFRIFCKKKIKSRLLLVTLPYRYTLYIHMNFIYWCCLIDWPFFVILLENVYLFIQTKGNFLLLNFLDFVVGQH